MRKMKDSGIDWIGMIPENWIIEPIFAEFKEVTEKNRLGYVTNALKFTYGEIVPKNNFETNDTYVANTIRNYTIVEPGTIMINGLNLNFDFVSQRVGLVKQLGVITSAYMAIKPTDSNIVLPEYATYLFKAYDYCKAFHNMGGGVRKILNFSEFGKQHFVYPDIYIQKKIVCFLDKKCFEIDSLSANIQSQIDTLEQYKKSVITEAVTKGLDKNVEMKETESQYWKSIPVSWNIVDIKYLFEIVKRIAGKEGYDVLSITQHGIKIKDISNNEGQLANDYSNYQFLYPGEFAMNHMDLLTGWVDLSDKFGVTSPDYRVFRLRDTDRNSRRYYKYVMQTCYMDRIFYSLGQGVSNLGRWRLQTSVFNNFKVPLPPKMDQDHIADYLDKKCNEIDIVIRKKQFQLETLVNYKKSLVYEYVTGKKEIDNEG